MDPRDEVEPDQLEMLAGAFRDSCSPALKSVRVAARDCFQPTSTWVAKDEDVWPEAARLRELAIALQPIFAQQETQNELCDEFLDLCTIHGGIESR